MNQRTVVGINRKSNSNSTSNTNTSIILVEIVELPVAPLQVTHITQDSTTGLLNIPIPKEEIRAGVFRPSWNQPTMSLEELGRREYEAAVERDQRQKEAELVSKNKPKRFD
jgi:TAP42-like family